MMQINIHVCFLILEGADGGLPRLELPPFETHMNNRTIPLKEMVQDLGAGLFIIPIVSVLANISIAKAFGKTIFEFTCFKNKYKYMYALKALECTNCGYMNSKIIFF